jgi:hypothetical protein
MPLPALLIGAFLLAGPDPTFPTPVVTRIEMRGDTVWFVGGARDGAPPVAYCHVRSTGRWCRAMPPASLSPVPPTSGEQVDSLRPGTRLPLAAGWTLSCAASPDDAERCGPRLQLRSPSGQQVSLTTRGVGAVANAVPFSTRPGAWTTRGAVLWLGLQGYSTEGEEERGGLVALDSTTGTARWMTHRWLDAATVTAIAPDSAGLWIGTAHQGEYGVYGNTGLVRHEPAAGTRPARWSRVTAAQGALPDDLVHAVAANAGFVAVATSAGLAVRGSDGRWVRRFWHLAMSGDSIVHELALEGPEDPGSARALRFLTVQSLRVPNAGAVLAALERDSIALYEGVDMASEGPGMDRVAPALAVPALAGPLSDAVRRGAGQVSPIVITAVGLLGAPGVTEALRPVLARPDEEGVRTREAAVALARLGDPAGSRWIRARLAAEPGEDHMPFADPRVTAAISAARAQDHGGLPLIVALLGREILPPGVGGRNDHGPQPINHETGAGLLTALTAYGTPQAWRAAVAAVRARPVLRVAFLAAASDDSAATSDPMVREAIVRETIAALGETGDGPTIAIRAAVSVARDARVVDALVARLRQGLPAHDYREAIVALVNLTGRHDAPYLDFQFERTTADRAGQFWLRWLGQRGPGVAPVTPDVGREAEMR